MQVTIEKYEDRTQVLTGRLLAGHVVAQKWRIMNGHKVVADYFRSKKIAKEWAENQGHIVA